MRTQEEWDYIQQYEHMCECMLNDEKLIVFEDYIKEDIKEDE